MIEIPLQLKDARFVLVRPNKKVAFQTGWNDYANYPYGHPDLMSHLSRGENYGVLSWNGVCQFDIDNNDIFHATGIELPMSLIIKRGTHGHYYFTCPDCPSEWREKYILTFGDVRLGGNYYVVGPGCNHPSGDKYEVFKNYPIASLKWDFVFDIITKYHRDEGAPEPIRERPKYEYKEDGNWEDLLNLPHCEVLLQPIKAKRDGYKIIGGNPAPGHTNQSNTVLQIDISKDVWHCFDHDKKLGTGGGRMFAYAVSRGIIRCSDARPGALKGKGKELMDALKEDGYDISKLGTLGERYINEIDTRDLLKNLGVL